jgi:hopanoid biosynthesis associated RND transporter like protein HpnN
MDSIISRTVEFSRRRARGVAAVVLVLAAAAAWYVATHISIDSDTSKLVDPNLPWQKASADLDRQFPQNDDLLVAVVDGSTPDQSSDAAAELNRRMADRPDLFRFVRQPDANPYFRRYGLLLLPTAEVQDFSDHLISAQPFLGTLAADPSLRGVLSAIDLLAQGALQGEVPADQIDGPLSAVAAAAEAASAGKTQPLAWQSMLSGRKSDPGDLRHFVLARAALRFGQVDAATEAINGIRSAAAAAHLTVENGVKVRVTGPVALNNDQLSALSDGAAVSTALCLGLLIFWLAIGLRSIRTLGAIFVTLIIGLIGCAAFAVRFIGPFNPVSIAFAPLFIGIAIDFGIQFSVRYSAERIAGAPPEAMRRTAAGTGAPLAVAAAATAVGFLAFAPTAYLGVRALGLIAGAGMIIALVLNLTLLPALLTLWGTGADRHAAGFAWGAKADALLVRRRKAVLMVCGVLTAASLAILPRLKFDFNPVDLENPKAESVRALFDLMADPNTSPYSIEFLAKPAEAAAAIARLEKLPEVGRILRLETFVPGEQKAKLDILADTSALLSPTLNPVAVAPAPADADLADAVAKCAGDMRRLGEKGDQPAARLAAALSAIARRHPPGFDLLTANLAGGIEHRLDDLREVLRAEPVSLATMPADFKQDWLAPDGRERVQVFPSGDTRDNATLRRFARSVQSVVPQAVGSAIEVDEWTGLAPKAFATAGALALATIGVLLLAVLRRVRKVLLVLMPLVLAGVFTLAAATLLGFSVNFANIITLPMILGIGVAFDIYFVMRYRPEDPGLLSSPTARGVVFSALTTGSAFGSLALSQSPGMAEMGKFLGLALFFILICTLFVLPALLATPSAPSGRTEKSP